MKKAITITRSVLVLSMTLGLTACAGGASKEAMTSAASYDMAAPQETTVEYLQAAESGMGLADTSSTTQLLPANRKLIRNVDLDVETDNFSQLLDAISTQITALGGYIEQSNISGNSLNYRNEPNPRYASVTARVPQDQLDGFISFVEKDGNITNKSESTQDVTLQYSDLESRKKSLAIEQERIWALLEKADTLEAVIALEQRLSDIRYQLESMESQLKLYDNQVDYSTIYLNINEVTTFTPTAPETFGQRIQGGFSQNLKAVSSAMISFIVLIITASPVWITLVIIILVILVPIRRHRRKKKVALNPNVPTDSNTKTE